MQGVDYDADMYCRFCGKLLANYCSNEQCDDAGAVRELPLDARTCPVCGGETEFARLGYFSES
jgi:rubredoxin